MAKRNDPVNAPKARPAKDDDHHAEPAKPHGKAHEGEDHRTRTPVHAEAPAKMDYGNYKPHDAAHDGFGDGLDDTPHVEPAAHAEPQKVMMPLSLMKADAAPPAPKAAVAAAPPPEAAPTTLGSVALDVPYGPGDLPGHKGRAEAKFNARQATALTRVAAGLTAQGIGCGHIDGAAQWVADKIADQLEGK